MKLRQSWSNQEFGRASGLSADAWLGQPLNLVWDRADEFSGIKELTDGIQALIMPVNAITR